VLGYKAKGAVHSTAIGEDAQANGACSIAIGSNCINSTDYHLKFWADASSSYSELTGVQFGNINFGISGTSLTIKNATSFDIRPTLKSGLSAPTNNNDYHNVIIGHGAKSSRFKNVLIGNNSQATSAYSIALGYNTKVASHSTAIGAAAQANSACSIAIGSNCVNSTDYPLKFWAGASSSYSELTGVQFGNINFAISGTSLTIKNATSFDVRPALKNGLSVPTNNNDIVTKGYVDTAISSIDLSDYATKNELPDLTYYLTADMVYIPPETLPIDVSGITVHTPDDDKLVTKKYVDDLFNSLSIS
jgi:hypothetical protein